MMNLTLAPTRPTIALHTTTARPMVWTTDPDTAPDTRVDTSTDIQTGDRCDDEPRLSSFARCADGNGTLSYLFFSDDDLQLAQAKAICRSCGLQEACLLGAIEREEPYGVWGGKLVLDGVPVEFKRKRGRPPKHPKPLVTVDEARMPAHLIATSVA
jgi:WhiB family redox-sensing transcriptional regulator